MATYAENPHDELRFLRKRVWELSTIEREKELALEENSRLNGIINYLYSIFSSPIPDDWKITLCILPDHIVRRHREHTRSDGLTHIIIQDFARDVGKHPDNAGRTLKRMSENSDLLEHDVVQQGKHDKRVYVRLVDNPVEHIEKTKLKNPTNLGGRRVCPNCKRDLRKVSYYVCDECHLNFDQDGNLIEPSTPLPLEPMQETIKPPLQLPLKISVIPHCQYVFCIGKPNQVKYNPITGGLFCEGHGGFVDAKGRPI